jgi:hypothetical protein
MDKHLQHVSTRKLLIPQRPPPPRSYAKATHLDQTAARRRTLWLNNLTTSLFEDCRRLLGEAPLSNCPILDISTTTCTSFNTQRYKK